MTETASEPPALVAAHGSVLVGLDRATGAARWQRTVGDRLGVLRLLVTSQRVYTKGEDAVLRGFDRATGRPLGEVVLPARHMGCERSALLAEGQQIFVANIGITTCVREEDGVILWTHELPLTGAEVGRPALALTGQAVQVDLGE